MHYRWFHQDSYRNTGAWPQGGEARPRAPGSRGCRAAARSRRPCVLHSRSSGHSERPSALRPAPSQAVPARDDLWACLALAASAGRAAARRLFAESTVAPQSPHSLTQDTALPLPPPHVPWAAASEQLCHRPFRPGGPVGVGAGLCCQRLETAGLRTAGHKQGPATGT